MRTEDVLPARRRTWQDGGHRVAVFGAASGIGEAIVRRFRDRRARLLVADLVAESVTSRGNTSADDIAVGLDVRDEDALRRCFALAADRWGGLDVVINCAGILGRVAEVRDLTPEDVRAVLEVNLVSAFGITRHALGVMVPARYGRILHVASMAGKEGNARQSAYSASKAGVIGMVKAVGKEYAATGVTINAVAPAIIDTPMVAHMAEADRARQRGLIPMGRLGTVEEVLAVVEFATSPAASFTTGFTYDVSGGRATY